MSARGGRTRIAVPGALALLGAIAIASPAAGQVVPFAEGPPKTKFVRGKIATDSLFTPLATETLVASKLPARMKFQILIGPPPGAGNCNAAYACEPAQVRRLPGTRRFRTSGKGRAEVSFLAPDGFIRHSSINPRTQPEFVPFKHGDPFFLVLGGGKIRKKGRGTKVVLGEAVARGSFWMPPR
ncbi:MAG: hypothetical protein ACRDL6_01220 [Solirubrobacterales bacterium]